jgi:hypothetical protein
VAGLWFEILACLADWDARPAGGGADAGDRRVNGVLPQVAGLPAGDFLQQARFGPAVDGCRGQHCVPELGVLPSAEGTRAGTARAVPPGPVARPAGPASLQRVRGQAEEYLAGERAVSRRVVTFQARNAREPPDRRDGMLITGLQPSVSGGPDIGRLVAGEDGAVMT